MNSQRKGNLSISNTLYMQIKASNSAQSSMKQIGLSKLALNSNDNQRSMFTKYNAKKNNASYLNSKRASDKYLPSGPKMYFGKVSS